MFERRDLLLNQLEKQKIESDKVALFGLGGVGGYTLEALVRMGMKNLFLCDGDVFDKSNLNRQILSTQSVIGVNKAKVAKERVLSINPQANVLVFDKFIDEETINEINFDFDYIVDAIDDSKAKVLLAKKAQELGIPIISMMGAGNRLSANFIVSDINKTEYDPLAKKMRFLLKNEGIKHLKVVYTKDLPLRQASPVGSISYVVGQAGLKLAEEVIKDIIS